MQTDSHSSSFSAVVINGGEDSEVGYLMFLEIHPISVSPLASITATVRWNDGDRDRSQPLTSPLSSLDDVASVVFQVTKAFEEDITLEADLTGSASCKISYGFTNI